MDHRLDAARETAVHPGLRCSLPIRGLNGWLAAGLALGLVGTAWAAGKGNGGMADTWVFYTRSVGPTGTLGGSFTADAAVVRTDASSPTTPRIGTFRRAMAKGEWDGLVLAVRSLGSPRGSGQRRPGAATVSIGIMAKGKAEVVHQPPSGALTPTEREVFSRVEAAVDEVMRHPQQVLEGGVAWEQRKVGMEDEVGLSVRVSNPGLVPVLFVHPASRQEGPSGFSVLLRRVGTQAEPREVTFSSAQVVEVGPEGKAVAVPSGGLVNLGPGKELRFRASSRPRLAPGDYRGFARLVVSGTIEVELPVLAVSAASSGRKR